MPASLSAQVLSGTSIKITWGTATDNPGGGVTGYNVQRCQSASCTYVYTAFSNERTFTNNSLTSGVTYTYNVSAFDGAGNVGDARSVNATTLDVVAPSAPSGLNATTASGSQIDLSWPASTDNVGVSGYRIERCAGAGCGNFAEIATTGSTSYSATLLASATSYSFRVRAYDAVSLNSGYSPTASRTTHDVTPPSAPASLTANAASGTQINLIWSAASDNVGVVEYFVESCQGGGCGNFAPLVTTSSTSHNATGLSPATSYRYRVRARDAFPNYGGYSPTASETTVDTVAPSQPSGLTATAISETRIDLAWFASTDNVGVFGYQVERCQGGGCSNYAPIATPTGAAFSDTGLSASTTYRYRVLARDALPNWSSPSAIAIETTLDTQAPSAPAGLTAMAASAAQVDLSWTASTDNVGVTGYAVQRCQGAGCSSFSQIATPGGTSFSDSGLSPTTTYRYQVVARDALPNWSSPSNIATALTPALPDTQAPSTPSALVLTAIPGQLLLSWNASTDNVSVIEYRVERCQVGTSCPTYSDIGGSATTTFADSTAVAPNSFMYRVRARDAVPNYSGYSNAPTAVAPACD
jgi:chitodextrinase